MENQGASSALEARRPATLSDGLFAAGLLAASTASWIALSVISGQREAWDSGAYFAVLLPLLWVASAMAGWLRPPRAWRWPTAMITGQALGLWISAHGSANLWPLGLMFLAAFSAPGFLAASLAARLARRQGH